MTTTNSTTTPKACPAPDILWRSSDRDLHVSMVEIPRELAFDLIRTLSVDDFLHTATEEELQQDLHYARFEAHKERMEEMAHMVGVDICDSDVLPVAETMLRTLSLIYEGSALLGKVTA